MTSIAAIALLVSPVTSFAQSGRGGGSSAGGAATTGSARSNTGEVSVTGPSTSGDAAVDAEDKAVDRKLKSICRGC